MSVRFGVLGLLAEKPLHGYQIKQRFEEMLGGTWDVNFGSIYQALQRLERDGLVEATGERGDRGRQTYQATAAGRSALDEWLEDAESRPEPLREELYMKVLLLGRSPDGRLLRVLNRQRHELLQQLRDLGDHEKSARSEKNVNLALLFRGGRLHTEADVKWLDECIEELEGKR